MTYKPTPIDTSDIALPESLIGLLEHLAENTHDVWAALRIAQGWSFGTTRNDDAKTHPCLVPYAELPESEKQYDRDTAAQALKAILKLGYTIQEPPRDQL